MKERRILLFAVACIAVALAGPFFGMSFISPAEVFSGGPDADVFWKLRVPRSLAAFLAGAGLAVCGLVFQALFRNPLATPYTLGISSGAALGASLYIFSGITVGTGFLASLGGLGAALLGSTCAMGLVFGITRARGGMSPAVMLLAGVIVSFFFSSLVLFVQYLGSAGDSLRIMRWLMGSLAAIGAERLIDLGFVVIAISCLIYALVPELDLFLAGEKIAASRGVATGRVKTLLFFATSIMVGCIVSLTGPIGFVGMMAPHTCRLWLGVPHRRLVPASFFLGGAFLALCDAISRVVLAPSELPVGIITALLGGPFFLWTLFRASKRGEIL